MNEANYPDQQGILAEIFDELPDAIIWLFPVFEQNNLSDFEIRYINSAGAKFMGCSIDEAIGKRMLKDRLPNADAAQIAFVRSKDAFETGAPAETSFTLHTGGYLDTTRKRFKDGVLVIARDRQLIREAQQRQERSEKSLASVIAHAPIGIILYDAMRDAEGTIIDFKIRIHNERSNELSGVTNSQREKFTLREMLSHLGFAHLFAQYVDVVEKGISINREQFIPTVAKWLSVSIIKFEEGVMIMLTDITSLKEARFTLERSAARLSAVFNASQSGMFTFAPVRDEKGEVIDFRFVVTNPTFAAYVNVTPDVLNGELGSKWFPGYLTNGVFDMYKHTYLTGETQRLDFHYNVDQHNLYLDLMSTKVGDEVLVTFNDYTPLKKAQEALENSLEELKVSNANLEEFASVASHDLKEPIRKIRFFAERLAESLADRLNVKEQDYLNRLDVATIRMASLIDDLLAYSHAGIKPEKFTEVDLNVVVDMVLKDFDFELEQLQTKLKINIDHLCKVHGDFRQLQQAFQNLIGNAIKYSRQKDNPEIKISCAKVPVAELKGIPVSKASGNYYHIAIEDNGIGFDQEYAEGIFNVFTRLHGNSEYSGTGVGLAIVKKVMEHHNGFIKAEGRPDEGAVFHLYFPAS